MKCENCDLVHLGEYGSGRFCSAKCARGFSTKNKRQEINDKVSKKLSGRKYPEREGYKVEREERNCLTCSNTFIVKVNSKKEYCSGKCNPAVGGYREGSGRAKTGYYNGIYCGSTYELVWVIYRFDNNMLVQRFDGCLENETIKYFPDFIEDNTIIEIKGYENSEKVAQKTLLAESCGYNVKVLYKDDLKTEFEWVNNHYTFKHLEELYDDYKPNYEYKCAHCGETFSRQKKAKTETVYCSRVCAGKSNTSTKKKNVPIV